MALLSNPTLEQLIKETRIILNQQQATNSFWSDEELTIYLNDAVNQYFLEINERGEGQFDKSADLDILQNNELVTLPTDCFEIKTLYKKYSNGYKILTYKVNLTESYDSAGGTSSANYEPYYYFRNNNLVLRPIPNFDEVGGLKVEYTAYPETMVWKGDGISVNFTPVFKEVIVMYAVYKAKIKEDLVNGSGTSAKAQEQLNAVYLKFKESVGLRSKYPQFIKPFNP